MSEWKVPLTMTPKDQFIELEICPSSCDRSERSGKLITFRIQDLVAVSGLEDPRKPGRIHLRSGSRYDTTTPYADLVDIMQGTSV